MGYTAHFFYGDGYEGKELYGPFDGILITAAIPEIPDKLLKQLKTSGRLVAPVGKSDVQIMTVVTRKGPDDYETSTFGNFVFVPMLKGTVNS